MSHNPEFRSTEDYRKYRKKKKEKAEEKRRLKKEGEK